MSDAEVLVTRPSPSATVVGTRKGRNVRPYVQVLVVMAVLTLVPHIGLDNRDS